MKELLGRLGVMPDARVIPDDVVEDVYEYCANYYEEIYNWRRGDCTHEEEPPPRRKYR